MVSFEAEAELVIEGRNGVGRIGDGIAGRGITSYGASMDDRLL